MATAADEVWKLLRELIQAQKETERLLQEQSQESDRRFRETERVMKEQNQRIDEQLGKLGNRLGEFADGATSTLESRQGKLHSSSSSNVILQSMAANLH